MGLKDDLKRKMYESTKRYDISGLDKLWAEYSSQMDAELRNSLVECYQEVIELIFYDLTCDKFQNENKIPIAGDLLDTLDSIKEVDPEREMLSWRAMLYDYIAECSEGFESKIANLKKAESAYLTLKQKNAINVDMQLASLLLKKMEIKKEYDAVQFESILKLQSSSLATESIDNVSAWVHLAFDIRAIHTPLSNEFFQKMIFESQTRLEAFPANKNEHWLEWCSTLLKAIEYRKKELAIDEKNKLYQKVILKLNDLRGFDFQSENLFDRIGHLYMDCAKTEGVSFYDEASRCFLRAQRINPAAWTHAVGAAFAFSELAKQSLLRGNKKEAEHFYIQGDEVYKTGESFQKKDFTFNLNWADYLIRFNKDIYGLNNRSMLIAAKEKMTYAKEKGENYYTRPFIGLAKIELKLGNKLECLKLLSECKKLFESSGFTLDEVANDEDFSEIWTDI